MTSRLKAAEAVVAASQAAASVATATVAADAEAAEAVAEVKKRMGKDRHPATRGGLCSDVTCCRRCA